MAAQEKQKQSNTIAFKIAGFVSIALVVIGFYRNRNRKIIVHVTKNEEKINHDNNANNECNWSKYEVIRDNANRDANPKLLQHHTDHFNGVRIDSKTLPENASDFKIKLEYSLSIWNKSNVRGVFLKLPAHLFSNHLMIALNNSFKIHHARPDYIMLTQWLTSAKEVNMIPDYCHSYLGVGCLIINKNKEMVMIREKWDMGRKDHWKLPGGAVDRCEHISMAAEREAFEETGIAPQFVGVIQFRHFYPFRFNNTGDIYFVCLLKYDNDNINNQFNIDENEIGEIKWIHVNEGLKLRSQSKTFGNESNIENIKNAIDLLIENWDKPIDDIQGLPILSFRKNHDVSVEYALYARK